MFLPGGSVVFHLFQSAWLASASSRLCRLFPVLLQFSSFENDSRQSGLFIYHLVWDGSCEFGQFQELAEAIASCLFFCPNELPL